MIDRQLLRASIAALWLVALSAHGFCQSVDDVRQTIETLFDGMRAGDSTIVRSTFLEGASMQSVSRSEDDVLIRSGSVDGFVTAIGSPHDYVWDERLNGVEVRIDGDMASVWAPYRFYLGDTFSHCGVNQFVLVHKEQGWKILSIVDTRRKDC